MTSICIKCHIEKDVTLFTKDSRSPTGRTKLCYECNNIRVRDYYSRNKEKVSERTNNYRKNNLEIYSSASKKYRESNKRKCAEATKKAKHGVAYETHYKKKNSKYHIAQNIRIRFRTFLKSKGLSKRSKFLTYLGCSIEELKQHLESKFQTGMTWENYGKWHIDHIIPLATVTTEIEMFKLFHYTNLQPLWAKDNLKKWAKIL